MKTPLDLADIAGLCTRPHRPLMGDEEGCYICGTLPVARHLMVKAGVIAVQKYGTDRLPVCATHEEAYQTWEGLNRVVGT